MAVDGITLEHIQHVRREADCLFDRASVDAALDRLADEIRGVLEHTNPLILCVMNGALIPLGHLLTRLDFPLQVDYVHASRYRGENAGAELNWVAYPSISLAARHVLIFDDIHDEGTTLCGLIQWCHSQGAETVHSAVLATKQHARKACPPADFSGLDLPDRYVFGYGMDYKEYLREAPGIYAVKGL
jgi:hypoxanthine phosphoribosyltransferase